MYHDPVLSDLTAPYICSVIADLKANHHPFYTLFIHAPQSMVCINLIYDFRTNRGYGENDPDPLCSFSVPDFMQQASTFHENDCFTVSFDEGIVVGTEDIFTAPSIESFYTKHIREFCYICLISNKKQFLEAYNLRPLHLSNTDLSQLNNLFETLNFGFVEDIRQIPCDVLKRLAFIRK